MFSRRLFVVVSAVVAALGVALIGASLLGVGGDAVEGSVHDVAPVGAGLFACVIALAAAYGSRGRRRLAWLCWSAYAVLEAILDWNALTACRVLERSGARALLAVTIREAHHHYPRVR